MPVNIGNVVAAAAAQAAQAAAAAAVNGTVAELIQQSQAAMPQAISDLQPDEAELEQAKAMLPTELRDGLKAIHVGWQPDPADPSKPKPVFAMVVGLPVGLAYGVLAADDEYEEE
jgi:hypothetical protein